MHLLTWAAAVAVYAVPVATQSLPKFDINFEPLFKDSSLTSLKATVTVQDFEFDPDKVLVSFAYGSHLSPKQRYDDDGLTAFDNNSSLPISYRDAPGPNGQRQWSLGRAPNGPIKIRFEAEPRGAQTFVPYPPQQERWNISISWTIPDEAPEDFHVATSLGEGKLAYAIGIPSETLSVTCVAAGPLQRWPAWGSDNGAGEDRKFGMYWIGDLPWPDSSLLASTTKNLYEGTANFFGDQTSDFRVFFRRDPKAFGGVGGYKSFFLEYTDDSANENPKPRVENLISHEIVHNFALTYPYKDDDKWYVEGVAEYLAAIGPYTGGTLDRKTFINWMNDNSQDYYTASPLGRNWTSLITDYWTQGTPVVKAPYTRGSQYLAYVHSLITTHTTNEKTLDDVILEMYHRLKDGEVNSEVFVEILGEIIGPDEADDSFEAFFNGTTLFPHPDGFSDRGLKMVCKDLPKFSLGMNEGSLGQGKVIGLVSGSNAEKAGVQKNDTITAAWGVWSASDTFGSKMQITVLRDGKMEDIQWSPRSNELVESWEWIEA